MKYISFFLYLFLSVIFTRVSFCQQNQQRLYLLEIDGVINPVFADYITENLKKITEGETVIIRMDTPGGLMDSMHQIIQSILNEPKPVIVWVGPSGARAASAGVFITMASDIACMAPGTNIGAAHPVQMGGIPQPQQPEQQKGSKKDTMEEKITNDAAAYIRAITKEKNRNWKWAEKAVTKSLSITSDEALKEKVIEFIFTDLDDLRENLDGKKIKKLGKEFIVRTKNIELVKKEMKPFKKFLNKIAHPNVAFILLMFGIYGLIYEFASPGIGFGAVVGSVCLILAFFSLQLLPVNTAGLLLLILGIILMILDLITPSFGILTMGGVISFIIGSLMLFDFPEKFLRVSLSLVIATALFTLMFFVFAVKEVIKVHKKKVITGKEGLIGEKGVVKDKDTVFVHGEYWSAKLDESDSESGELKQGEEVEVINVEGKLLKVKRVKK